MRLKVVAVDDVANAGGFYAPTSADAWRTYLRQIRHPEHNEYTINEPLLGNLAHRFQLLEFETALLLCDFEVRRIRGNHPTLHETVKRFKIHQLTFLSFSILEGIGAHLWRAQRQGVGNPGGARQWQDCLAAVVSREHQAYPIGQVSQDLQNITEWRDMIHLDRPQEDAGLQFNRFDYDRVLLPCYRSFIQMLDCLNDNWPENCVFAERPIL